MIRVRAVFVEVLFEFGPFFVGDRTALLDGTQSQSALEVGTDVDGQAAGDPLVVEPMTGIEPAYSAWEADVLPLNYIGTLGFCRFSPARPELRSKL